MTQPRPGDQAPLGLELVALLQANTSNPGQALVPLSQAIAVMIESLASQAEHSGKDYGRDIVIDTAIELVGEATRQALGDLARESRKHS
jgi:hypothetical protein